VVTLPEGQVARDLAVIADGSVGRFLQLAGGDGAKLNARVAILFKRLPQIDWPEVLAFVDDLQGVDKAERFDQAYELLLDRLARLIKARLGQSVPGVDIATAERVIAGDRIVAAAALWTEAVRQKAELDAFNLDKRTLMISLVQRLARLGL
jgi:hypothetical protein